MNISFSHCLSFFWSFYSAVKVNCSSLTTMNNESTADTSQQPPSTDKQLKLLRIKTQHSKKLISADDTSSSQATRKLAIFFLSFFMTTCHDHVSTSGFELCLYLAYKSEVNTIHNHSFSGRSCTKALNNEGEN